jgi:hypothetical protein
MTKIGSQMYRIRTLLHTKPVLNKIEKYLQKYNIKQ